MMAQKRILICVRKGQEIVACDYTHCCECGAEIAYSKRAPRADDFVCVECVSGSAIKVTIEPETAAEIAEYFQKKRL